MRGRISPSLFTFAAALFAAMLLPPASAAADGEEREIAIPLTRLVLYTSGVGYFQHEGTVDDEARMELTFSTGQINDLLKSLVLQDLDGGAITSVTYSSRDPITRTLKSFSIDLTSNPSLASLLVQTRGEAAEVLLSDGTKNSGTIVSVESRESPSTDKKPAAGPYLNLNAQAGIMSIALSDIQGIRFLRKEIQDDLAQALQVLSSSHGIEKKKVILHFTGAGKRRVRIGYILESPIWKTSYRLVLGDGASHFLQGWAMVENTTDSDWKGVGLNLVSGRPITFTMDLYQPLYIQRPEVQLELYQSLRPRTNQMAMEEVESEADEAMGLASASADVAPAAPSRAKAAAPAREAQKRARAGAGEGARDFSVSQGVSAAAQGGQVGNLFQYTIEKPVILPRQQSALLPIVNQAVGGERFSLYNEATHRKYPLHAVMLKNSSSLYLMQGPITVFDGGAYAGDAQITDFSPGAKQLVSYAMDLETEVEAMAGSAPESLVSVRIAKGIFTYTNKQQRERIYSMKNRSAKNRTILVEHPYQPEWTLVEPKEPMERTRDSYRFAVSVAAGKSGSLSVKETRMVEQGAALTSMPSDRIDLYLRSSVVSARVKSALQGLLKLKGKLSDTIDQRTRREARMNEIANDQSRIRANMDRLSQGSDLYKRYVRTLTDQEEELARLREETAKLRDQEADDRKAVEEYILKIDEQ
jgi:hypothetical protein